MTEPLKIELDTGSRSVIKAGLLVRAGFILLFVIGCAWFGVRYISESLLAGLICVGISLVLFMAFFKIINAAFFKETVIVDKKHLNIIHKTLSDTRRYEIDLDSIRSFGFAHQQYTRHPLDNPVVDFTGLATQERELQYVIDEGNILIETDAMNIKFGKNMPSWDVEELIGKIEQLTGRQFNRPRTVEEPGDLPFEPEAGLENDEPEEQPGSEQVDVKEHTYTGDFGHLVIEQKKENPSAEDRAFLNGVTAPSGKYQVGPKQFVLISNGIIYAVRGFGDQGPG